MSGTKSGTSVNFPQILKENPRELCGIGQSVLWLHFVARQYPNMFLFTPNTALFAKQCYVDVQFEKLGNAYLDNVFIECTN